MENQFWYFLIGGERDEETGVSGSFYSYGEHCGDALAKAFTAAEENSFHDPYVTEAARLDDVMGYKKPGDLVKLTDQVYWKSSVTTFPLDDHDFVAPVGIVKGTDEGEFPYGLIREGFVAYEPDEDGFYQFELVVEKDGLIETFLDTISFLPGVDGFWIYIWEHWDNQPDELWIAEDFDSEEAITAFLIEHKLDTLENGYVDCVVHCFDGETNLTLDEHKKIRLSTQDGELFNDFIKQVMELGFEQSKDFYTLEFDYEHLHYRPAGSLPRAEFKEMLADANFEFAEVEEE